MLPQWTVDNNYQLASIEERNETSLTLPLESLSGITTTVQSGKLPIGLYLLNNQITGVPIEVARSTKSTFVIRATSSSGIQDRTLSILINGQDKPQWATPPGALGIGPNKLYFVLDNSYIDYQLEATDVDLPEGNVLEYYIGNRDGELPPGLELTKSGKITGKVDPILSLEANLTGTIYTPADIGYDSAPYTDIPFDYTLQYTDSATSEVLRSYRKLNRTYQFTVTITDGISLVKRSFSAFIVSDTFVKADNEIMKASNGVFTADATDTRIPIWLTAADLGTIRANNYATLFFDVEDQNSVRGTISYALEGINDDGTTSAIPKGLTLDNKTGEIAGIIPYKPAVSENYKFTLTAIRTTTNDGAVTVYATAGADILADNFTIKVGKLPLGLADGIDDLASLVEQTVVFEGKSYIINGAVSGAIFDEITFSTPLQPLEGHSPLVLHKDAAIGQNYFFSESLNENDRNFYKNKTLTFSSTENYLIEEVYPYITYSITAGEANANVQLNATIGSGNDLENLQSYFGTSEYEIFSNATASTNQKTITITVPSFSNNTNINRIKSAFITTDSSNVIVTTSANIDIIKLTTTITALLAQTRSISIGATIGNYFEKTFGIIESQTATNSRTFSLKVIGEVDSTISWNTSANLGTLKANRPSLISVKATTINLDTNLVYTVTSGKLPPGIKLTTTGELIGTVVINGTVANPGLSYFDNGTTTFDNNTQSYDKVYKFTIQAKDRFQYSEISRTFTLTIDDTDKNNYSDIHFLPMIETDQRNLFNSFINDTSIFVPRNIYRENDPNFGIQRDLKSLVYAGIIRKNMVEYISVVGRNHTEKSYYFGNVLTAFANEPGTNNKLYEVVYVPLIDSAKPDTGETNMAFSSISPRGTITIHSESYNDVNDNTSWRFRPLSGGLTIDSDAIETSQTGFSRYHISNIDNMRKRINSIGTNSYDFTPLWMRTAQGTGLKELGYAFVVPLVYTIPGKSAEIALNIKNSSFDFKSIEYRVNRYLISQTNDYMYPQFVSFGNKLFNV
mgnify:CR=1 FL=1